MKAPAAGLGANAVVGIYDGGYRGVKIGVEYVSGLAVQMPVGHSQPAAQQVNIRVGILPVQIGMAEMDKDDYAELDRDFRAGARWFLEDKGYYAPVDPGLRFTDNVNTLIANSQSTTKNLYGSDTELLLLIELLEKESYVPVLVEYRKVVLKTSLYSKLLNRVIWENQVANERVSGVFWTWMTKPVTRSATIEQILKPLPFYLRPAGSSEFVSYQPDMVKKKKYSKQDKNMRL